jgi:hypothetical protein
MEKEQCDANRNGNDLARPSYCGNADEATAFSEVPARTSPDSRGTRSTPIR